METQYIPCRVATDSHGEIYTPTFILGLGGLWYLVRSRTGPGGGICEDSSNPIALGPFQYRFALRIPETRTDAPLKKRRLNLQQTIEALFDAKEPQAVLHLLSDFREISGAGESQFVSGACWIAPLAEVTVEG